MLDNKPMSSQMPEHFNEYLLNGLNNHNNSFQTKVSNDSMNVDF